MKKFVLAAALIGTALTGSAHAAQTAPAAPPVRSAPAEMNRDATVARAEFLARAGTRFDARDANKDGTISGDERTGRNGQAPADAPPMTRTASLERAAAMFDRLDTNRDGKLDPAERQAMRARMGGMMRGGGDGPQAMHAGHRGTRLARLDLNKDGRISRDEMRERADARFARLDANKDGFIDQTEIAAVRTKMRHHAAGATPAAPLAPPRG